VFQNEGLKVEEYFVFKNSMSNIALICATSVSSSLIKWLDFGIKNNIGNWKII